MSVILGRFPLQNTATSLILGALTIEIEQTDKAFIIGVQFATDKPGP